MREVHVTAEHLQQAFQALRKSDWEPSVEQALQHPLHAKLLRLWAMRAAVGEQISEVTHQRPPIERPEPPQDRQRPSWIPRRRTALDLKRAAAGDRDD